MDERSRIDGCAGTPISVDAAPAAGAKDDALNRLADIGASCASELPYPADETTPS